MGGEHAAHLSIRDEDAVPFRSLITRCQLDASDLMEVLTIKAIFHRVFITLLIVCLLFLLLDSGFPFDG
jgi:hypothetical protein